MGTHCREQDSCGHGALSDIIWHHCLSSLRQTSGGLWVWSSDSGTKEPSDYSSKKLFIVSLIDFWIHDTKTPSRPESGSKNNCRIGTFWERPPNPELWAGWPWRDMSLGQPIAWDLLLFTSSIKKEGFAMSPLKEDTPPKESCLNSGQRWLQSWLIAQPQNVASTKLCLICIFFLANAFACSSMHFSCRLNDKHRCHQFPPALSRKYHGNTKPRTKPKFLMLSV